MRVPRVYLETSVFNFVFADDAPDKRQDTLRLFEEIRQGKYEPYTSEYVLQELEDAPEDKRQRMLQLISDYCVNVITTSDEAIWLADAYVEEGIIPVKYRTDALHIAVTSVMDLNFIASWNFKHIVKRKTILLTESVNAREGYNRIGIYSPTEVIENG
ncbi:MAG: type II toxin-antitoxin system VapC family toxin [Firmicutes bacterium]|nr:type II toxin-antitoxin system VapC family toxin [Bacillota bacterium]